MTCYSEEVSIPSAAASNADTSDVSEYARIEIFIASKIQDQVLQVCFFFAM